MSPDTLNSRLREAILQVINMQIENNDPPETKETLIRLQSEGFSEDEALRLIGYVVASEVFSIYREDRTYRKEDYIAALLALPRLPWETET